jgi:hypothetical protein
MRMRIARILVVVITLMIVGLSLAFALIQSAG